VVRTFGWKRRVGSRASGYTMYQLAASGFNEKADSTGSSEEKVLEIGRAWSAHPHDNDPSIHSEFW
jgi:hypothetical protein